jgi:carbonic anhydrase|uniref:carbonic anhydrase n=1 Tax=viral metagenome TaxID=1070528 RepID=A0A6C0B262_9ZZZZ
MSIFSSNNWPPSCSSAKQSPINLTQSGAKPCNLSCDLVMDDGNVTQASVSVSDEGLILESSSSLGSCKFRGESYVCQGLSINHPSHHTIEGVQADGEVTAIFRKPTGELMCMSTLFRINSAQTPSYGFFKQFVPYAVTTGETKLQMKDWSISALVPPEASYYVYEGSTLVPPCAPCEWVVFKSMINMDQGDFAYLVRNAEAGSRPVQGLGDRDVFFNDTNNVPGGPMPHDNKFYLKLRPTGNTRISPKLETKAVDLKSNVRQSKTDAEEEAKNPTTLLGHAAKAKNDYVSQVGTLGLILAIVAAIGIGVGIWKGYEGSRASPVTFEFMRSWAIWTREKLYWLYNYVLGFLGWLVSYIYGILVWLYNSTIGLIPYLFNRGQELAKEAIEKAAQKRAAEASAPK